MKKPRHRNGGLRKVCKCTRRAWPKCDHSWYLNYQPRGGLSYQLSLDVVARERGGQAPRGKTEAAKLAKGATANNHACLSRLTAFTLQDGGTLGDKPLGAITEDDVEAFFARLREEGRAASTVNKYVQLEGAVPVGGEEEVSRPEPHRRQRGHHARQDGAAAPAPHA